MENFALSCAIVLAVFIGLVVYCNIGMQYGKLVWKSIRKNDHMLEIIKDIFRGIEDRKFLDLTFRWYHRFLFPLGSANALIETREMRKAPQTITFSRDKLDYNVIENCVSVLINYYFFNKRKGFFYLCAIFWPFFITYNILAGFICGMIVTAVKFYTRASGWELPDFIKDLPDKTMQLITIPSRDCVHIKNK